MGSKKANVPSGEEVRINYGERMRREVKGKNDNEAIDDHVLSDVRNDGGKIEGKENGASTGGGILTKSVRASEVRKKGKEGTDVSGGTVHFLDRDNVSRCCNFVESVVFGVRRRKSGEGRTKKSSGVPSAEL